MNHTGLLHPRKAQLFDWLWREIDANNFCGFSVSTKWNLKVRIIWKNGHPVKQNRTSPSPSDYNLFPKLKKELSGRHFDSDDDVMAAVADPFLEVQDSDFYKEGICMLYNAFSKCVQM